MGSKEASIYVGGMMLWENLQEVLNNEKDKYKNIDFTKNKYLKITNKMEELTNKFYNNIKDDLEEIAKEEAYKKSLEEPVVEKNKTKYPLYTFDHGDSEENWYRKLVEIYNPEDIKFKMKAFWYEYVNDFEFTEEEYSFYKKHFNDYYYWEFPEGVKDNYSIINTFNQIDKNHPSYNNSWDNKELREFFMKYAKFKD